MKKIGNLSLLLKNSLNSNFKSLMIIIFFIDIIGDRVLVYGPEGECVMKTKLLLMLFL
jgi:hypothetical protein